MSKLGPATELGQEQDMGMEVIEGSEESTEGVCGILQKNLVKAGSDGRTRQAL